MSKISIYLDPIFDFFYDKKFFLNIKDFEDNYPKNLTFEVDENIAKIIQKKVIENAEKNYSAITTLLANIYKINITWIAKEPFVWKNINNDDVLFFQNNKWFFQKDNELIELKKQDEWIEIYFEDAVKKNIVKI